MKPESLKLLLVSTGAVVFNLIFWQEKMALNVLFFDAFILSAVFYLYRAAFSKPVVKWLLAAHIITVGAVIIHNTVLSKIAFSASLLLVVAFTQYVHRSAWYAGASAIMNYLLMLPSLLTNVKAARQNQFDFYGIRKALRFLIIPLLLLFAFILLYNFANAVFSNIMNDAGVAIQHFFSRFFDWFSWQRFGFLLLGLFITGGLLLKSKVHYFSLSDNTHLNDLGRNKNDLKKWQQTHWFELLSLFMGRFANGIMALRNENTTGIISLALLNLLLLCINCIDIIYVWFGFEYDHTMNLSAYVHEGAGLLIFSIVLAMFLLLFFFRGNLNFYKKNQWLRYGAYAWLLQNAILVFSVLLRDYYYIVHWGLAYKRIGVLIFLMLVLVGLITVFIKIRQLKTTYYLMRVNAWFAFAMLVASSCVHWDELIAGYNLARKTTIPLDVRFLLTLSDKTLPLLEKNTDILDRTAVKTPGEEGEDLYRSSLTLKQVFENRKRAFVQEQQTYSWLSWNEADAYVKRALHTVTVLSTLQH